MTAIPLRRHVAVALMPPTRGLGEQRRRPPIRRCSGWRLPRFTRFPVTGSDSSLWPCSSLWPAALTAGVWRPGVTRHPALGSPDFPLRPFDGAQRQSGWLRTARIPLPAWASPLRVRRDAPAQRLPRAQRHDAVGAERTFVRHLPGLAAQRQRAAVAPNAVEVRAMQAREAFELVERTGRLERLRIELERRRRRVAAGAAARVFLRVTRM